jgi:hypothetical protein
MLLKKSDTSRYCSNATDSRKYKLDPKSPTDDWLELTRLIRGKYIDEMIILEGVLKEDTDVVIKIGKTDILAREYDIGHKLQEFLNFIRYYCNFNCLDTANNLENLVNSYLKKICTNDGKINIGVLVMPYYILGDIESYAWRESELGLLKNVLKQICFSLMYAYERIGFLHNDEHLGNILLRITNKKSLKYGDLELPLEDLYVVITDFEKSTVGTAGDVFISIRKLIHLVCVSDKSDLMLEFAESKITKLQTGNVKIQKEDYNTINDIIDNIKIRYVKSKLPKMKWS